MVRKKSKYRNVVINKKRYYFYRIEWWDILGDSGHADANEFMDMTPVVMITNAYVFYNDSKVLRTFSSYDSNEEVFSDRNVLPKGCIKKMERILD